MDEPPKEPKREFASCGAKQLVRRSRIKENGETRSSAPVGLGMLAQNESPAKLPDRVAQYV
jgi:hypothetical protein